MQFGLLKTIPSLIESEMNECIEIELPIIKNLHLVTKWQLKYLKSV